MVLSRPPERPSLDPHSGGYLNQKLTLRSGVPPNLTVDEMHSAGAICREKRTANLRRRGIVGLEPIQMMVHVVVIKYLDLVTILCPRNTSEVQVLYSNFFHQV